MLDWSAPAVAILLGLIAVSGTWLTVSLARQGARQKREDTLNKRVHAFDDYCRDLREQIVSLGGKPKPYPKDLYDE